MNPNTDMNVDQCRAEATKKFILDQIPLHFPDNIKKPHDIFNCATNSLKYAVDYSLPVAVSLVMHFYPLCTLHHIRWPLTPSIEYVRKKLIKRLKNENSIIANAGGERTHTEKASLEFERLGDNTIKVWGSCDFMSLAGIADYVLIEPTNETESCLCVLPTSTLGFTIDEFLFHDNMRKSNTAKIILHDCIVDNHNFEIISQQSEYRETVYTAQRLWFHLLLSWCYLQGLKNLKIIFKKAMHRINKSQSGIMLNANIEYSDYCIKLEAIEQLIQLCLIQMENDEQLNTVYRNSLLVKYLTSKSHDKSISLSHHFGIGIALDQNTSNLLSDIRYIKIQPTSDFNILKIFSES